MNEKNNFLICQICGGNNDWYMVQDNVWKEGSKGLSYVCIKCLEKNIRRKLTSKDFTDCPANIGRRKISKETFETYKIISKFKSLVKEGKISPNSVNCLIKL